METMEEKRKRPRRSFSDEYKAEVVELCRTSGMTISDSDRIVVSCSLGHGSRTFIYADAAQHIEAFVAVLVRRFDSGKRSSASSAPCGVVTWPSNSPAVNCLNNRPVCQSPLGTRQ